MDATGSMIKSSGKRILIYSLCSQIPENSIKCLPILEWLTDVHDGFNIAQVIKDWKRTADLFFEMPQIVVSDFSWANLHAISDAFNGNSLEEQMSKQWKAIKTNVDLKTIVRLCANHLMHMVCRRLKALNVSKKVKFKFNNTLLLI